jgi:hypothetical protein
MNTGHYVKRELSRGKLAAQSRFRNERPVTRDQRMRFVNNRWREYYERLFGHADGIAGQAVPSQVGVAWRTAMVAARVSRSFTVSVGTWCGALARLHRICIPPPLPARDAVRRLGRRRQHAPDVR